MHEGIAVGIGMKSRRLRLFTGMPPGTSGTGQLVEWLRRQGGDVVHTVDQVLSPRTLLRSGRIFAAMREAVVPPISRLLFRFRFWLEAFLNTYDVVLLHPQSIGMRRTIAFIRRRKTAPVLFLLDSSYFCIRSYNYLPGGTEPCLHCLGGHFDAIHEYDCVPFPFQDDFAETFVRELRELVAAGRLRVVSQCQTQAGLAKRHFGVDVPVVGLWVADWVGLFDARPAERSNSSRTADIVFHGLWVEAKGARWLMEVADRCPDLRFLFPCPQSPSVDEIPSNCTFLPMSWDSGLAEAAADALVVVVPSLWSAPVESAVIKSLLTARAVAVVDNPTAFASEIPGDVVLRLSADPVRAADELSVAVRHSWQPKAESRARFLDRYRACNEMLLQAVHTAVARFNREGAAGPLLPTSDVGRKGQRR